MWTKPITVKEDTTLGYEYFLDKTHPLANGQGKVYYHRHIASLARGRWLTRSEHVHHLDGSRNNNIPSNLIVMTASEHARTHRVVEERSLSICPVCGGEFYPHPASAICCSKACARVRQRKFNPSREELKEMVWKMPSTKVAEHYGVGDTSITQRCKLLGVAKPGRGYWTKRKYSSP